jgi:hypothetical protein
MEKEKCGIFCSEELAVLLDRLEAFPGVYILENMA